MNKFQSTSIEFHILQSFPVSCLNRDDVGAPKTAMVGGVSRARVTSQCWKRQIRISMQDFGARLGTRTKKVSELMSKAIIKVGGSQAQAELCGKKISSFLTRDTLLFVSGSEVTAFAEYAKTVEFDADEIKIKDLEEVSKKAIDKNVDALDISLFGRMVAKASSMNVEAATCVSHAISTHKVSNEIDAFTALNDLDTENDEVQSTAHMGITEFNSATYYRYVSLNLGQLAESIGEENLATAIETFTKALFVAVPSARQSTQSAASPWEYAKVLVRKGQRLQVPFEAPVKAGKDGFLKPSIEALKNYIDKKEKLSGSMFGKIADFEYGEKDDFNIDDLIKGLTNIVE